MILWIRSTWRVPLHGSSEVSSAEVDGTRGSIFKMASFLTNLASQCLLTFLRLHVVHHPSGLWFFFGHWGHRPAQIQGSRGKEFAPCPEFGMGIHGGKELMAAILETAITPYYFTQISVFIVLLGIICIRTDVSSPLLNCKLFEGESWFVHLCIPSLSS